MQALALALLLATPRSETLSAGSLPPALRAALGPAAKDATFQTERFSGLSPGDPELWLLSAPGPQTAQLEHQLWRLTRGRAEKVGRAHGALLDWEPDAGWPRELFFAQDRAGSYQRLRWNGHHYDSALVQRGLRDPLTREPTGESDLRARALADLNEGRYDTAAGRYALLCRSADCAALDYESLATAALAARLLEQAERALRQALALPGHQRQDWDSLASLLRAEGRNADAEAAEAGRRADTQGQTPPLPAGPSAP